MKTKEKNTEKAFDAVRFMRERRDQISKEIMNLSPEGIVKYFDEKRGGIPHKAQCLTTNLKT